MMNNQLERANELEQHFLDERKQAHLHLMKNEKHRCLSRFLHFQLVVHLLSTNTIPLYNLLYNISLSIKTIEFVRGAKEQLLSL